MSSEAASRDRKREKLARDTQHALELVVQVCNTELCKVQKLSATSGDVIEQAVTVIPDLTRSLVQVLQVVSPKRVIPQAPPVDPKRYTTEQLKEMLREAK